MSRPVPLPDALSAPYWEAAARHQFVLARCSACDTFSHPPDVTCPACHTPDPEFRFEPVSGRGTIRTWTVIRQSFLSGLEIPFMLVDVQLDDHPHIRMLGRLLDGPEAEVAIGDPVSVAFDDVAQGVAVPAFRLEPRA